MNIPGLNPSQTKALRESITRPLSLIQGPPGTGKTKTACSLILAMIKCKEKRLSLGDDFITTIFHEMTHVKQLVYKEFFTECNFYESRDEYLNLPWEVEAYAKQEELLEQWKLQK